MAATEGFKKISIQWHNAHHRFEAKQVSLKLDIRIHDWIQNSMMTKRERKAHKEDCIQENIRYVTSNKSKVCQVKQGMSPVMPTN